MEDIILCATIGVDCVENDLVNIEHGEPKYLGFVFNVRRDEAESMIKFIGETLAKYNVPVKDIYVYHSISLPLVMVWDKERIEDAIKRDAEYLIKFSHSKSK